MTGDITDRDAELIGVSTAHLKEIIKIEKRCCKLLGRNMVFSSKCNSDKLNIHLSFSKFYTQRDIRSPLSVVLKAKL
jgi:hypothetical protein